VRILRSIRWQLQAWHGLLLAVILGGLGVTAYQFERTHQLEQVDQRLQSLTGRLANASRPRPGPDGERPRRGTGPRELNLSPEDAAAFQPGGGYYYAIWLKNGAPFTASADAPADMSRPPEGESGLRSRDGLREAYFSPAPEDIYLVGTSKQDIIARSRRIAWTLAGGGLAIFAAAMLVGAWFIHRSLRPISAISSAATHIAAGDLSRRINTKDTGSELGELTQVLNSTFERLETAFTRQARFTADAAHELRTPVTVLLTHIQNVLTADDLADDNREALEACQRAAQRMRRLIESLLQLARFDGGQESWKPIPCDLATIARDALEFAQPLAEDRGITLHSELSPAPMQGDPDRLAQVLINLLSNAIHYNKEQGEIRITTQTMAGEVLCTVTNTGMGISPEHLPHIFERFYRADAARTGGSGRTGLGLAISRAIVEGHQGRIEASSEPGGVATFTVRFPATA